VDFISVINKDCSCKRQPTNLSKEGEDEESESRKLLDFI
jgi:hypothetical protein